MRSPVARLIGRRADVYEPPTPGTIHDYAGMLARFREFPAVAALLDRVAPHPEYDDDPWDGFCDPQIIVYTGPSWWRPNRPVAELRWWNAVAVLRLARGEGPDGERPVDLVVDLDIDPADVLPDGTILVSP